MTRRIPPQPARILRSLTLLPLFPVQLAFAGHTAWRFGFEAGALQAVLTLTITALFVEGLVGGYQKLPFTCSRVLETPQLVIRFMLCFLSLVAVIPLLAIIEHWTLGNPRRLWFFALLSASLPGASIVVPRNACRMNANSPLRNGPPRLTNS